MAIMVRDFIEMGRRNGLEHRPTGFSFIVPLPLRL